MAIAGPRGTAIVVGLDSITGLQSARILAARGVGVVGIASNPRHFAVRTRASRRTVHAATSGEGLLETLAHLAPQLEGPATLLPCTDGAVLTVSAERDRLDPRYRFVLPAHDVVETLLDKVRFAEHAQGAGLPIPMTFVLRGPGDLRRAGAGLRFPAVVKPAVKTAAWFRRTNDKAIVVADRQALEDAWERFGTVDVPLLAQEWVPGADTDRFTANSYYDRTGVARIMFVSHKIRQWPPDTGTGCLAVEARDERVVAITRRLFESVGYTGLAYLELKHDPTTDEFLMIEANVGRPTGRSAMAEAAGVELLLMVHRDAHGLPLPDAVEARHDRRKWIYLRHDLQASVRLIARGELTLPAWWASIQGPKTEAVLSLRDPLPFVADIARSVAIATPRLAEHLDVGGRLRRARGRLRRAIAGARRRPLVGSLPLGRLVSAASAMPIAGPAIGLLERLDPPRDDVLAVLTYHRVAPDGESPCLYPGLVSASPALLQRQLEALGRRFTFVSADEVLAARCDGRRLPQRALLVTFDDAYRDFGDHAWPILRRLGVPATLFVPTAYPDSPDGFWWDRLHRAVTGSARRDPFQVDGEWLELATRSDRDRAYRILRGRLRSLPHAEAMAEVDRLVDLLGWVPSTNAVLGWAELRALAAEGVRLAPHTRTHAMLDRLEPAAAVDEIRGSLDDLERETGSRLPVLAYPAGQVNATVMDCARRAGIDVAFSTRRGTNDLARASWLGLRRINVGRRSSVEVLRAQLLGRLAG